VTLYLIASIYSIGYISELLLINYSIITIAFFENPLLFLILHLALGLNFLFIMLPWETFILLRLF